MRLRENELRLIYLIFDLIILNLAIFIQGWLRMDIELRNYHQLSIYLLLGNLALILTFFIFVKKNLYLRDGYLNRIKRITQRSLIFTIILGILGFLFLPKAYSRSFILEYAALFYLGKLVFYRLLYTYLTYRRLKGLNTIRVLIVGEGKATFLLRQIIESNPMLGYKFIGFASNRPECKHTLGTPEQLAELIEKHQIQMVFASLPLFPGEIQSHNYLNICSKLGVRLRFVPENQRWLRCRLNSESVGDLILINPLEIPMDDLGKRILKRSFDILFSSTVILLFFTWAFPIIALLIKLSSKGPVFFVQERTGFNNQAFRCIKFRSMQQNEHAHLMQATANDQRITRIGKFLRKSNLDELPQFINVLLGDMSIVGPRPHMISHTEQYSQLIDQYLVRHYVKPGITGWAQINGYRGETRELWKMEKRVEHDVDYIENWTFWWDLAITWKTVFNLHAYKNAG